MRKSVIFLVCLLISSIQLFSQTSSDKKCYDRSQLIRIATKLEKGNECDTLLFLSEIKILNQDTIITNDSIKISNHKAISIQKELIIKGKDTEIQNLNLSLQRSQKRTKWVTTEWIGTSILLITIILLK